MPDYKKLYITMISETEKAINILIEAQKKCEELYITAQEPEIKIIDSNTDDTDISK